MSQVPPRISKTSITQLLNPASDDSSGPPTPPSAHHQQQQQQPPSQLHHPKLQRIRPLDLSDRIRAPTQFSVPLSATPPISWFQYPTWKPPSTAASPPYNNHYERPQWRAAHFPLAVPGGHSVPRTGFTLRPAVWDEGGQGSGESDHHTPTKSSQDPPFRPATDTQYHHYARTTWPWMAQYAAGSSHTYPFSRQQMAVQPYMASLNMERHQQSSTSQPSTPLRRYESEGRSAVQGQQAPENSHRIAYGSNLHANAPPRHDDPEDLMKHDPLHPELQNADRVSLRLASRVSLTSKPNSPVAPPHAKVPIIDLSQDTPVLAKRPREDVNPDGVSPSTKPSPAGARDVTPNKKQKVAQLTGNASPLTFIPAKKPSYGKKRIMDAGATSTSLSSLKSVTYLHTDQHDKDKGHGSQNHSQDPSLQELTPEVIRYLVPEMQFARCMSTRYKEEFFPRCVSCTRRWAGDTCRFQGVRIFLRDASKAMRAIGFLEVIKDPPKLIMPNRWNVPLTDDHIRRTLITISKALLPHLREEMKHCGDGHIVRRPRETDVRATCDTCMTSLFCNSWMCRQCGREACPDCYAIIMEHTKPIPRDATPEQRAAIQQAREQHASSNPLFLSCTRRIEHGYTLFSRVSRFVGPELTDAVKLMSQLEGIEKDKDISESNVDIDSLGKTICNPLPPGHESSPFDGIPSHDIKCYQDSELTETNFRAIWRKGEPIVVEDILRKFCINWTPEYFIEKYGQQSCLLLDCQKDGNEKQTVGKFFSAFGQYDGRSVCHKLKDWPPSTDFKTAFPELFNDFSDAVPAPSFTRRDGVINIASHFPSNTIAPDLGPKMYNAYASEDTPNSKGTTRLHMDMADAINIMLYTTLAPDGKPGCAAWDIYRAEDANTIRQFLKPYAPSKTLGYDPIHSQQFYLDPIMRKKLYEEYGVKSWRIYQRPGEAVFIPAGCAHQVCNLADCIKVACDFVSLENIERCERLTTEFREQNHSHIWKEDVLQLRSMMWFAWLSCKRVYDERIKTPRSQSY